MDLRVFRRAPARRRGASIAATLLAALVSSPSPAQVPAPAPAAAAPEAPSNFQLPPYLRGVDLALPAQSAFKSWPPKELVERPYWLPWTGLSFQRAALLNQPIFLMLTVPWSHAAQMMSRRALADPVVLRTLNQDYVSIGLRADRRPDVMARYGSGEWPSITLLLPDGSPMLSQANTQGVALPITLGYSESKGVMFTLTEGRLYFDKWQNFLHGISDVYEKRVDVEEATAGSVELKASDQVARWLLGNVDAKNGGFEAAPKYVIPGLVELAYMRGDRQQGGLVAPARATFEKMAAGPLHDAVDGGFHRMAAAPEWGAIQYEKPLGANADALRNLVFAVREADSPALKAALADTARFLTTRLARPGGGFYNAQVPDPDSPDGGAYWKAADRAAAKAPPVDRLVLAGPNALAGGALLRAAALLGDDKLAAAGRGAVDLVLERSVENGRGASHVVEPDPEPYRFLVTQADVALGLVDAYEATGEARYLAAAKDVVAFVRNNLRVKGESAYRDHLVLGPEIGFLDMPLRPVQANARVARVLTRLDRLGALPDGRAEAEKILVNFAGDLASKGVRGVEPALAIEELLAEPVVITIDGPPEGAATRALRRAALNARHGWTLVGAGTGKSARAVLAWHGTTRTVTDPAALPAELEHLLAGTGRPS